MLRSTLLLSVAFLLGALVAPPAHAQSTDPAPAALSSAASTEAPGIVMLVRRPQHIRASIQTVRDLRASDSLSTTPVEIVVCGKAVRAIQSEDPLADAVARASGETVRVLACGMSLNNLGVAPSTLADDVTVVPNGLAHALKRQAAGYLSVDL
jgi:intracellular sulfur oxidation DsrE/DsrF family protein